MNVDYGKFVKLDRKKYEELVWTVARSIMAEDEKERKAKGLHPKRNDNEASEYRKFFDDLYNSFVIKTNELVLAKNIGNIDRTPPGDNANIYKVDPEHLPRIIGDAFVLPDAIVRALNSRMNGRSNVNDLVKICHLFACRYSFTGEETKDIFLIIWNTFKQLNIGMSPFSEGGARSSIILYQVMKDQNHKVDPGLMFEIVKHTGYDIEKIVSLIFTYCIKKRYNAEEITIDNFEKEVLANLK